jgi:hypothetical protein
LNLPETASFAGFANILGIKPSAVTALRHAGRLVLTDDSKRVQVAASQQRLRDTADPSKSGVVAHHAAERASKGAGQGNAADAPAGAAHEAARAVTEPAPAQDRAGSTYQASRAVRERYLAMEAKRAYEVAIGKLMDANEVAVAVAHAAATLRTRLESLPDVLGPQLAAITDEAQARATLAEAIQHALEETSRQFANIAERGAI